MIRRMFALLAAAACGLTAAAAWGLTAVASVAPTDAVPASAPLAPGHEHTMRPACPAARPGHLRCLTLYRSQAAVNLAIAAGALGPSARPKGWGARQLESAYKLPVGRNPHQTVAVSIAFDTPKLAHYLAVYRKQFGLPPCTVAGGCFRKVNQRGKSSPLPQSGVGTGWDIEATLDVSMLIAGVYGLAGNARHLKPGSVYRHARSLFDVTAGNGVLSIPPGLACGNDYLCAAKPGYDSPTGLGTPNGTGAF